MKRICMLALLCLQALVMSADVVKIRVMDADSNEPLGGAQLEIIAMFVGEHYGDWTKGAADSCGLYYYPVESMARVQIEASYFGYESKRNKMINVSGGKDTISVEVRLKMSAELLNEVEVTARARRFTMKGDTVVFNPEAFHLDDGDRIATLLRKLPGVSIKEGKIYFKDKEVHLKMNGHDVTDEELTAMLPAEAVQNIKAYEKKSEQAELSGMNDGQEQQVLDIVIKPGFMDKWYGQTKASAYASKNYRASANMHYLSDKKPLNLFVRASDCGSKTYGVYGENDYEWESSVPQRQQYGKFSYTNIWKPKFVKSSYEDNWSLSTTPDHIDSHQHSWSTQETFLPSQEAGGSVFSNDHNYNYSHGFEVPVNIATQLHFGPKTTFRLDATGGMVRGDEHTEGGQQTYHGEDYAGEPQSMVNESVTHTQSHTDHGYVRSDMSLNHSMERGDFYVSLNTSYTKNKENSDRLTEYDYHELGTHESLHQTADEQSRLFQTIFDTKLNYQLVPKKLKVGVGYWLDYWHKADDSQNYRNDAFDFANSYDRTKSYLVNEPRFEAEADLGKVWLHASVKVQHVGEHFDYQRGKLDTLVRRNTWFPRPEFEFRYKTSKTTELKGGTRWDYHVADLLDGLDYTDDTNPLYIRKGNTNLKASSNLSGNLSYNLMLAKGQQILTWRLDYNRVFHPASGVSAYNPVTGAYVSRQTNIDYRERWSASANYERSLGGDFFLRNVTTYSHNQDQGFKTLTVSDVTAPIHWDEAASYQQRTNGVSERVSLTYDIESWWASLVGECTYDGVSYSDPSLSGQDLWGYRIGLSGRYKMEHWTFNLDASLRGNSGYLSSAMNRDRVALNASVTWKMLKNKGQLTLTAKDILNQMAQTYSRMTPTMRLEGHTETFHRYLSLSFTYNFDARAKKK